MMRLPTALTALAGSLCILAAFGCGNPAIDNQIEALGPEGPEGESEFHRPGQPCVLCHGGNDEPRMSAGGTVFYKPSDGSTPFPVGGFVVRILGSEGEEFNLPVNCNGNFHLRQEDGDPAFPWLVRILEVVPDPGSVTPGATKLVTNVPMLTRVGRDGSCAGCHTDPQSAVSPGVVFVRGEDSQFSPPTPESCPGAFSEQ